jgi:AraC-like DNA-binding protein
MAGIPPTAFEDDDNRVSFQLLGRLFSTCVQLIQCEHFGLLVGERSDLTQFGAIGYLMNNSPTVGDALRSLVQSLHLHDRGAAPILLTLDMNRMLLGYSIYRHGTPATDQIYDVAIAVAQRILCQLCGPEWTPLMVQLTHKQPRDSGPYRQLFRSRVSFDADISGIVIDGSWMLRPVAGADPVLYALLSKVVQEADAKGLPLFKDKVLRVLRQMLLSGTFSSSAMAELFGVHERTMRRRLDSEGTSLQQLVNQTRFELAKELLENTALPVAEIARTLQYGDPNAFSRAFRGWANLSPNQWRKAP